MGALDWEIGLRFYSLDFGFAFKRETRERISTVVTLSLNFISFFFWWRNPESDLNCCC